MTQEISVVGSIEQRLRARFGAVIASIAATGLALTLAACSLGSGGNSISSGLAAPEGGLVAPAAGAAGGPLRAKVAVLLPLTGSAQSAAVAKGMKQAA